MELTKVIEGEEFETYFTESEVQRMRYSLSNELHSDSSPDKVEKWKSKLLTDMFSNPYRFTEYTTYSWRFKKVFEQHLN